MEPLKQKIEDHETKIVENKNDEMKIKAEIDRKTKERIKIKAEIDRIRTIEKNRDTASR